ncbi:hypothetical protein KM914_18335, partial [Virgibacillus pantothenticus]|uniref:hypothetical protein n=1 Tax=Virgibacillus pantothenticus TaxID=1473 RepID=UPI001C219936
WAHAPDVAIQLFPYPKATNFILSYSFRKTWLVAKSYDGSLCFSYTINQKNLILSYSAKKQTYLYLTDLLFIVKLIS